MEESREPMSDIKELLQEVVRESRATRTIMDDFARRLKHVEDKKDMISANSSQDHISSKPKGEFGRSGKTKAGFNLYEAMGVDRQRYLDIRVRSSPII